MADRGTLRNPLRLSQPRGAGANSSAPRADAKLVKCGKRIASRCQHGMLGFFVRFHKLPAPFNNFQGGNVKTNEKSTERIICDDNKKVRGVLPLAVEIPVILFRNGVNHFLPFWLEEKLS